MSLDRMMICVDDDFVLKMGTISQGSPTRIAASERFLSCHAADGRAVFLQDSKIV
jgi:hypothetical protein